MRLIPRVLVVLVMFIALFFLIRHVRALQEVEEGVDLTALASYYFAIIGLCAVTAIVSCITLLPLMGEYLGNVFFAPNEKIERNVHADALARLAGGDILGAIDEYLIVYEDNPEDILAASEIVRLYCEKLGEYDLAADFLVEALGYADRTAEDAAFLSQRLVDVCWNFQHDGPRARAILLKIIEEMEGTREAANALHRLQEIERAMQYAPAFPVVGRIESAVSPPPSTPPQADAAASNPELSENAPGKSGDA